MAAPKRRIKELPVKVQHLTGLECKHIALAFEGDLLRQMRFVTQLRNAVQRALAEPELVQKLNVTGKLEPLILSPAEFSELIRRDDEKYRKLVADIGIKIDK